jgi:hypothetical protein
MLTFGDYSNTVYITIKLWPPLYVFKTSGNLMDVFLIRDPIFTVKGAVFSATNSSLVMEVEYSSDFYGELTIEFVPN